MEVYHGFTICGKSCCNQHVSLYTMYDITSRHAFCRFRCCEYTFRSDTREQYQRDYKTMTSQAVDEATGPINKIALDINGPHFTVDTSVPPISHHKKP